jgi:hypothetical protein
MLTKDQVLYIREKLVRHEGPVVSVYADVNPAKPENARSGWLIRVKNTLKEIDLPPEIRAQALAALEQDTRPAARTLAFFWGPDVSWWQYLQCELPVVDLARGRVEARWGQPYLTPLLYAIDEYERAAVLWMGEKWRLYEVFLGEIEELSQAFAAVAPEDWARLRRCDPAVGEDLARPHPYPDRDRFSRRMEAWASRFLKWLAHLLERAFAEREASRLVLLGRQEATRDFEQYLSRTMRARVVAHVTGPPSESASPAIVLEKVAPVLEAAERAQEQRLLDAIQAQPGVWGLDAVLGALQQGRVLTVAAPWSLDTPVWCCPHKWAGTSPEAVRAFCPNDTLKQAALRDLIPDIAGEFGARLEFVRGEAEARLRSDFGGLAGLLRWV